MNKICPLMTRRGNRDDDFLEDLIICQEGRCAFWISGYTTEKRNIQCCAIEFLALKNEEGLYRV